MCVFVFICLSDECRSLFLPICVSLYALVNLNVLMLLCSNMLVTAVFDDRMNNANGLVNDLKSLGI